MGVSTMYPNFRKCTLTWREVGPFHRPFSPPEALSAGHQNTNSSSSKHTMAIFFAAVINLASTRFKADKGFMDVSVHLRKKRGAGGQGEATV